MAFIACLLSHYLFSALLIYVFVRLLIYAFVGFTTVFPIHKQRTELRENRSGEKFWGAWWEERLDSATVMTRELNCRRFLLVEMRFYITYDCIDSCVFSLARCTRSHCTQMTHFFTECSVPYCRNVPTTTRVRAQVSFAQSDTLSIVSVRMNGVRSCSISFFPSWSMLSTT